MKLRAGITINGRYHPKGSPVPWYFIYPFFLFHMGAFGASGFFLAYGLQDPAFTFMHGGIAILVYLVFYLAIFGLDRVKWMFINAALGFFGIYAQIDGILGAFGRRVDDYPWYIHVVPFVYYILYTFLLYQLVLDLSGSRENAQRRRWVEGSYVALSILIYSCLYLV